MKRWEQYEVWALTDGEWEFRFSSRHFDLAWAVTRIRAEKRSGAVRMMRAVYNGNTVAETEIIADLSLAGEPHP